MISFQTTQSSRMPINNWNFFRSVSACNDQKSWLSDNPQVAGILFYPHNFLSKVEDGREGGNQDFDDGISDQYEDEVSNIMKRALPWSSWGQPHDASPQAEFLPCWGWNVYHEESAVEGRALLLLVVESFFQREDEEFAKEQKRRAKEKHDRRVR